MENNRLYINTASPILNDFKDGKISIGKAVELLNDEIKHDTTPCPHHFVKATDGLFRMQECIYCGRLERWIYPPGIWQLA